jgi:hypothetical protein
MWHRGIIVRQRREWFMCRSLDTIRIRPMDTDIRVGDTTAATPDITVATRVGAIAPGIVAERFSKGKRLKL